MTPLNATTVKAWGTSVSVRTYCCRGGMETLVLELESDMSVVKDAEPGMPTITRTCVGPSPAMKPNTGAVIGPAFGNPVTDVVPEVVGWPGVTGLISGCTHCAKVMIGTTASKLADRHSIFISD